VPATVEMNAWRRETPGAGSWSRSARPAAADKYFMVSADTHANEPPSYLADYIEPAYLERIPRAEVRADGSHWLISEGNRPQRVKAGAGARSVQERQSYERPEHERPPQSRMDAEDQRRNAAGREIADRLADQKADGIDVEIAGHRTQSRVTRTGDLLIVQGGAGDLTFHLQPRFRIPGLEETAGGFVAHMPGKVIELRVAVGDRVSAGDTVIVLEAMKMEHPMRASEDGVVREVRVSVGEQVEAGTLLIVSGVWGATRE